MNGEKRPVDEFAGTSAIDLLLSSVQIKDVVERERFVRSDHNLRLAGSHRRTDAAHLNALTC